jgi:hypothetical protein
MGRRHHFVPRFYLKAFASAPKRIHLLNLRRELCLSDVSLRDQCYSHRLYGQDDEVEDAFASLESAASPLFAKIIRDKRLPRGESIEHRLLLTFLSLQLSRTIAAQSQALQMSAVLGDAVFDGSPPPDWELSSTEAMAMMLGAAMGMRDTIMDLAMALVRAPESVRFATSDNPVFRYNTYCEGVRHLGVTGTQQRGFQVFFPLSPTVSLHLFDAGVYKVGSRRRPGTIAATVHDVHELNRLQLVSANENVYFSEWILRTALLKNLRTLRSAQTMSRPRANVAFSEGDDQDQLVHQFWPMPQLNLKLSFVGIKRNARRTPLHQRSRGVRPSQATVPREHSEASRRYTVRRRV